MLQNESVLEIADNSGVQRILIIRCLGGSNRRYSGIGDLVVATVKKVKPNYEIKKGQIVLALIVTTKKYFHRQISNTWIKFSHNYAVIIKKDDQKKYKLVGTRVLIPLISELYKEKYKEITSLSQGML